MFVLWLKEGETAVHVAARKGHHQVVKRLLMIGALVDDRDVVSVININ